MEKSNTMSIFINSNQSIDSVQTEKTSMFLNNFKNYAHPITMPANTTIINEGEKCTYFPLVLSGILKGVIRTNKGKEMVVYYSNDLQICPVSCSALILPESKSFVDVITETESKICLIPISVVREQIMNNYQYCEIISSTLATTLIKYNTQIDKMMSMSVLERLEDYLTEKANIHQSSFLNLRHEDIALDLNTSREFISKNLKKLEKQNKLKMYRNHIKLFSSLFDHDSKHGS